MLVRTTSHNIEGQIIDLSVIAPTISDPTTRRVTVTDGDGNTVVLEFEHDGFQLFKRIMNEY